LRCWISSPSPYSFAASLDRSPGDVYTLDVCRAAEVLPFVVPVFVELIDYMTLKSALVVFADNVHAGTSFPLLVFKGMRSSVALHMHRIDLGLVSYEIFCEPQHKVHTGQ
jgi:hypothetical protein